jgi:hypothetical protein
VFATQHPGKFEGPHAVRTTRSPPHARAANAPNREHGTVQAPPHQRPQPMHPQPSNAPVRGNARPNLPPPRGASQRRNPPPHSAQSGQSQPRASHAHDHGKAHHDKHKPDNGQHR